MRVRLPERLAGLCAGLTSGAVGSSEVLPLADVEALLFELDGLSGSAPGVGLETAGRLFALQTRSDGQSQGTALVRFDASCRALTAEFIGSPLAFSIDANPGGGFRISLDFAGRPRSARLLRHFLDGVASVLLNGGGAPSGARSSSSVTGDRVVLTIAYDAPSPASRPTTGRPRRHSSMLRAATGPVSQQVNAILDRAPHSSRPPRRRDG